jgi:hypothetical protein
MSCICRLRETYTVVRGEGGALLLLPRAEIDVNKSIIDRLDDWASFRVILATGRWTYFESKSTPFAELGRALQDDDLEHLSRAFDVTIRRDEGIVVIGSPPVNYGGVGVPFKQYTVELTADTWAVLREKMLALLERAACA